MLNIAAWFRRRHHRDHRRRQEGQSVVELALLLPVLLLLLLGIMEFGRIFFAYVTVASAARESGREAALGSTKSTVEERLKDAASTVTGSVEYLPDDRDFDTDDPPSGTLWWRLTKNETDMTTTIRLEYSVPIIAPLVSNVTGDPLPVGTSSIWRLER